ncbi:MAG: hypothetical protein Q8K86_10660 [Candidatus Nanopelagicaceae bacterium]|nr:hypothetical protein [Candidatus Nanopelagicaceae bacterium]
MTTFERKLTLALEGIPSRRLQPVSIGRDLVLKFNEAAKKFVDGLRELVKLHPKVRLVLVNVLQQMKEVAHNLREDSGTLQYENLAKNIESAYEEMIRSIPNAPETKDLKRKLARLHLELVRDVYEPLGMTVGIERPID